MTFPTPIAVFASQCKSPDACQRSIVAHFDDFMRKGTANRLGRVIPLCGFAKHKMRNDKPVQSGSYAWAWSERTGKYLGCSFWSVAARNAFDDLCDEHPALSLRNIEDAAQGSERGPLQLQHEHVFPRKEWKVLMNPLVGRFTGTSDDLRVLLDRYCQGCVVTRQEHLSLNGRPADHKNPWRRYSNTGIELLDNPAWSAQQRQLIGEAGLPVIAIRRSA